MEPRTKANLVIWAISVVGCAAMTAVAYDNESPEYPLYVVFALMIAALIITGVVVVRKKIT